MKKVLIAVGVLALLTVCCVGTAVLGGGSFLLIQNGSRAALAQPPNPTAMPVATKVAPKSNDIVSETGQPAVMNTEVPFNENCPTEREFKELTGVSADIDRTEYCSFHWRGDPHTILVEKPCPEGWSCTLGINGQTYLYRGDKELGSLSIFSGTWRLVALYPKGDAVHDSCAFLGKVQREGAISDPPWTVMDGNLNCK